jgi:hypothetical protein
MLLIPVVPVPGPCLVAKALPVVTKEESKTKEDSEKDQGDSNQD